MTLAIARSSLMPVSTHSGKSVRLGDACPDYAELVATLIHTRQQRAPRRLLSPGPSTAQMTAYFEAAAAAPDHGQILPWRFVVIPPQSREALGEVFAQSLLERDPGASEQEREECVRDINLERECWTNGRNDMGVMVCDYILAAIKKRGMQ